MQIMLTLPDTLVFRLISQARSINLTFNEFLLKTLLGGEFLPAQQQESMNENDAESDSQNAVTLYDTTPYRFVEEETLADVVQRIKSRPSNPANIHPPTKTADELLLDLEENPPEDSEISPAEWDQMWADFEYGIKISAREKAVAEGRV